MKKGGALGRLNAANEVFSRVSHDPDATQTWKRL